MNKHSLYIIFSILLVLQAYQSNAKRGVMPWMCLERCNETSTDIQNNLQQIKNNANVLSAVAFELFNLGPHSQLIVNDFTRVDNIISQWGLDTYAMVSSFPYPPEFLDWLRQLFANPDPFIDEAVKQAKKYGFTGYNLDFEPTSTATPDDCHHYVKFLTTFSNAMHEYNIKVTVDIADWNGLWCDWALFGNSSVDKVMTMSTYTKNFNTFSTKLDKAVTLIPLNVLGVGLECDVGLTSDDMSKRFDLINAAGVQEIDIWKSPVPDFWWPLIQQFVANN
jgi:hypothetical protein